MENQATSEISCAYEKLDRWYAVLSIDGNTSIAPYQLALNKAPAPFPSSHQAIDFFTLFSMLPQSQAVALDVKLFAQRKHVKFRQDHLVAQGQQQLKSLVGEVEVHLTPTAKYKNLANFVLVLNVGKSERFDPTTAKINPASLEISSKLSTAMTVIRRIANIGMGLAELAPVAKAVVSLVNIGVSELDALLKRNESVLLLVEQVAEANTRLSDWGNKSFDKLRPHQQKVLEMLLPEILECLNFLHQLCQANLVKRLSDESNAKVEGHRKVLIEHIRRLEWNQQLDTQTAVFGTANNVAKLRNDSILNKLHVAKDVGPVGSKTCLEGTRVALLNKIYNWALDPAGERTLLLTGAAGMERSSSQLIPTWMKYLAEYYDDYWNYLEKLHNDELSSTDIMNAEKEKQIQ
ncbi:hypothetical protein H0H92_011547 [Tricholoma furcatifolium]|nr:hypothetical protein H0H92_011547 [Tricholoma furcatifolium]